MKEIKTLADLKLSLEHRDSIISFCPGSKLIKAEMLVGGFKTSEIITSRLKVSVDQADNGIPFLAIWNVFDKTSLIKLVLPGFPGPMKTTSTTLENEGQTLFVRTNYAGWSFCLRFSLI